MIWSVGENPATVLTNSLCFFTTKDTKSTKLSVKIQYHHVSLRAFRGKKFRCPANHALEFPGQNYYDIFMGNLYVACTGRRLASLEVNGHRVLILSPDREALEESLHVCGGDRVQRVEVGESNAELEVALSKLARRMRGGDIIVAPRHVPLVDLVQQLQTELPWYH